ncbi:MAG: tRNA (adenosine(37)-N6)-threonylcarbamoyltransferase complex ATPase subunit type 1 TsaE [Proteobacteria bacterium]|nr:tRNA (adenosine(37)-N6)-threonylcarbamoyltransferase complex ATPase subunit type 1 TsaE [Pseudomonadota bacterium]MBU4297438.1 tRNA (adenosine(37)-N6)-threonylcarbamoyltransferase complex ATPase subunit type 1 TsaE [Pseudomonadota bacterium]MCG2746069.1 tRNA (adenosine(37)-N6)-threonylcarbamoyltransferase complex ATPase subunit type 1 TsaE [Desulfobulbaceae bacterium]
MKPSVNLILDNLAKTVHFGRHLGNMARAGDIFTLSGDLGSGKTTLTQAIGQGLAVPTDCFITSPTFSLLHEYPGRIPLYHMDLYRLASADEVAELGFEDYLYGNGLTVIEWPDRLQDLMPADRLDIHLTWTCENSRLAVLTAYGNMVPRLTSFQPE